MKIVNKAKKSISISEIPVGGTFLYCGNLYIKTNGWLRSKDQGNPNSVVCLEDGSENGLGDTIKVIPVDSDLEYR